MLCVAENKGQWSNQNLWQKDRQGDVSIPSLHDFRFPQQCKWDFRSSGMLSSVDLLLVTDVVGQPKGPIFKHPASPLKLGSTGCHETSVNNNLRCVKSQNSDCWCVPTLLKSSFSLTMQNILIQFRLKIPSEMLLPCWITHCFPSKK
jgi:hypothetical protein